MTPLSAKDRNILGLYAARMSTASIAFMCSSSESAVYNRLGRLQVSSVAQALEMLRADDQARKAPAEVPAAKPRKTPGAKPEIAKPVVKRVERYDRPAASDADLVAATPVLSSSAATALTSPAPAASPTAAIPPAYRKGGMRLKPVTDRIARWAGHFLRARWPLPEVADLFSVAEDDLVAAVRRRA
ncbi:hypothetical protein CA606_18125 [Caulobacter vibrioides]|uniref:Uncharacterized protein n=1 Tax=Caulobacter vibrioides TaxID=155892 RepID=A0A290MW26_CAUVI|nr:hypothetical protein [Caulobacter vibrioides]ATC34092.1 hypothetical protein CA606_18125 [Caulobacter vibrioides]